MLFLSIKYVIILIHPIKFGGEILNYDEKLILIRLIEKRLGILRDSIEEERIDAGLCPHEEWREITTFIDLRDGYRVYACKRCGKKFKEPILSEEE